MKIDLVIIQITRYITLNHYFGHLMACFHPTTYESTAQYYSYAKQLAGANYRLATGGTQLLTVSSGAVLVRCGTDILRVRFAEPLSLPEW